MNNTVRDCFNTLQNQVNLPIVKAHLSINSLKVTPFNSVISLAHVQLQSHVSISSSTFPLQHMHHFISNHLSLHNSSKNQVSSRQGLEPCPVHFKDRRFNFFYCNWLQKHAILSTRNCTGNGAYHFLLIYFCGCKQTRKMLGYQFYKSILPLQPLTILVF